MINGVTFSAGKQPERQAVISTNAQRVSPGGVRGGMVQIRQRERLVLSELGVQIIHAA